MAKKFPQLKIIDLLRAARLHPGFDVLDRDEELARLARITQRQRHNNIALIGKRGVGKSSLVHAFAKQVGSGAFHGLGSQLVIKLHTKSAVKLLNTSPHKEVALEYMSNALASLPSCILVIDDSEQLLELLDEPWQFDQLFEPFITHQTRRLWLVCEEEGWAATQARYDRNLKTFEQISLPMLRQPSCEAILLQRAHFFERVHHLAIEEAAIKAVFEASKTLPSPRAQPDRALRLLDEVCSAARVAGQKHVDKKAVQQIVAVRLGLPPVAQSATRASSLRNLDKRLSAQVIGQEAATRTLSASATRALLGLKSAHRPLGSFLFLGPSGVGKTELAKALAQELYGSPDAMVRIDMSEFSDAHTVQRLLGAPPGYIGYDAGGQLTNPVMERPYSLVLLDEIEKAHPAIFDIFLQILDDGRLTDGQGQTVDFSKTIIIATSNIGIGEIVDGWQQNKDIAAPEFMRGTLMPLLQQKFRLEFLNRFEAISVFKPLSAPELLTIARLEIKKIEQRLAEHNVQIAMSDQSILAAINKRSDPRLGARPVKRFIEQACENMFAEHLMKTYAE